MVVVSFKATNTDKSKCPFANETVSFDLHAGCAVRLHGPSGIGKTTLASYLAGLSKPKALKKLGIQATVTWADDGLPVQERVGVLFQSTTLIDSLTIAANVCVALDNCPSNKPARVKELLEAVGLDYARDAGKRPRELSGGMARRASLALQLAQHKRVIVLDEPFTGLDIKTATSVAKEIVRLQTSRKLAIVLICHEEELAQIIMKNNQTITLQTPTPTVDDSSTLSSPNLFGRMAYERFLAKLLDYTLYSLPLILLTFTATGLAIAMLSSDILRRIDVTDTVLEIVQREVKPLLKMVTGEDNPMYMMMINVKVRSMLNTTIPKAKATLYALGMAKLFVLEIGPLITALLLSGRIGGSYAGEVATMESTSQNALLRTLGVNPRVWTLLPSLGAALLASPILTVLGTLLALYLGALVGPSYGVCTFDGYLDEVYDGAFPPLRLTFDMTVSHPAVQEHWLLDTLVEVVTYPLVFHLIKACTFIILVMVVAEICSRWTENLSPRGVPGAITSTVVIGSLTIILADWAFSQLLLKRY